MAAIQPVATIELIANLCNMNFGEKQKDFLDFCDWKMWGDEPSFESSAIISNEEWATWRQYYRLIEMYYSEALTELHHKKIINHNDEIIRAIRRHIINLNPEYSEPTECGCDDCFLEPPHPEQCNYSE